MRLRSHLLRVTRCIEEVAMTSARRLPPESIPISPKTSPGPNDPMTSPPLITSAVPVSMTIKSYEGSPSCTSRLPVETDVSLANTLTVSRAPSDSDENSGMVFRRSVSMISQTFAMAVENGPTEYDLGRAAPVRCTLPPTAAGDRLTGVDLGWGAIQPP